MTPLVVVVDSAPLRTRQLATLLEQETRNEIMTVASPSGCLKLAEERVPDAVIALHEPGHVDGVRLARALRKLDEQIVILLMTHPSDDDASLAARSVVGPVLHLHLPLGQVELLARLNPALDRRMLGLRLESTRDQLKNADLALRASRIHIEKTTAELASTHSELATATERLVAAEELAAVGRVVSGIAHEISNQLALVGYAEAIKAKVRDPELIEFADIIVSAHKRLAAMVDEIRDFAIGPVQIHREPADLVSMVEEALAIVRYDRDVRARLIERRFTAHPLVEIHRQKFCQVIINLVTNSVWATKSGDTVRIEILTDDDDALVRVIDWGEGMGAATLRRLGEPFFTTRGARGSGLGVGICMQIVRDHGGSLSFESELGQGTTATVRLPQLESVG